MNILNYKTDSTSHKLTSRSGLVVLGKLQLSRTNDRLVPKAPGNRTYQLSAIFNTFMLMKHDGARSLDDVCQLAKEPALMKLLAMPRITCAHTLGNWLRGPGSSEGE